MSKDRRKLSMPESAAGRKEAIKTAMSPDWCGEFEIPAGFAASPSQEFQIS
jgi:hypothetical protein